MRTEHTRLLSLASATFIAVLIASGCSKTRSTTESAKKETEPGAQEPAAGEGARPANIASAVGPAQPFAHAPVPKESLVAPPLSAPAEATTGGGGVRMQLLRAGTGDAPGPTDTLIVDYSMWTGDGTLARSSYTEERSPPFSVATLSPPLRSLLTALRVGAKARYWIPRAALEGWRPEDWPDSDLIVELELKDVSHVVFRDLGGSAIDPPSYAPPDTAGPPSNAIATRGGLRYLLLVQGSGQRHPNPGEKLALTLDGYAVDGLIAQAIARGQRSATTLERAPGTLSDVLAQLKSGDTARVWFPPKLGAQVIPETGNRELILDVQLTLRE